MGKLLTPSCWLSNIWANSQPFLTEPWSEGKKEENSIDIHAMSLTFEMIHSVDISVSSKIGSTLKTLSERTWRPTPANHCVLWMCFCVSLSFLLGDIWRQKCFWNAYLWCCVLLLATEMIQKVLLKQHRKGHLSFVFLFVCEKEGK